MKVYGLWSSILDPGRGNDSRFGVAVSLIDAKGDEITLAVECPNRDALIIAASLRRLAKDIEGEVEK